ncbi:hypothetical protein [Flavobacterium sp.]|uniref:hypothetical protein n=1 Tax=Flavobacterium sp. TaxID=239 RepID=UPI00404787B4
MTLYLFKCSNRETRTGLTPDRTGANLPANACQGGSWVYWKSIEVNAGDPGRIGAPTGDEILAAIERDGYYINDVTITFTERT